MWDAIVDELEVKMEQGVDVRVIYDDLGSISSFNFSNVRELKKKGICIRRQSCDDRNCQSGLPQSLSPL